MFILLKENRSINEGTGRTDHTFPGPITQMGQRASRRQTEELKGPIKLELFTAGERAEQQLTWRSRCELVGSLQSCLEPNLSSEERRRWRIRAPPVQPKELKNRW